MNSFTENEKLNSYASAIIREKAYNAPIYKWMKKYGVGESNYGRLMDMAGKHEAVHRLYGHHLIYDFPKNDISKILDFLEHEFSDLFTKQGLPIIPGEILKSTHLIKYCKSLQKNWNFINGFDLLSGSLSIYAGYITFEKYINSMDSIDSFHLLAKELGIGVLELALSIKNANPFLLIGSILQLVGTGQGLMNDSSKVYFRKNNAHYYLVVTETNNSIDHIIESYSLKHANYQTEIKRNIDGYYLH